MQKYMLSNQNFFLRPSPEVARDMIGCELFLEGVGGMIVETEAYERDDPASHSYRGMNRKNFVMFGAPGCAYVYRCYGIHWCFNMVCLPGSALLVRALEPGAGIATMQKRRGVDDPYLLCSGPGKLCQALGITGSMNASRLDCTPFALHLCSVEKSLILAGPRIGIKIAQDKPWRFGLVGSSFLSQRFPSF